MNLDDLRTSVSKLSDEELYKLIMDVRKTRRNPAQAQPRKSPAKAKVSQDISTSVLLSALKPEDIDALISKLENQKGGN